MILFPGFQFSNQTYSRQILLLLSLFTIHSILTSAVAGDKPELMLAKSYQQGIDVSQYWISEKLDGVRAHWDGSRLISRNGNVFASPTWFTDGFPTVPMDGELWIDRGHYDETSSIVRKKQAHNGWKDIKLMLFDLPAHDGTFSQRLATMQDLVVKINSPYLGVIKQFRVTSDVELMRHLNLITENGGEGLMLQRQTALYTAGRSNDLLKLKLFDDIEVVVTGYRPGKGQFEGMIGSLHVRTDQGIEFYVGSGLNRKQRINPPPISTMITIRYQGLTKNGIPRFPVFLRVRNEGQEELK